MGLSTICWKSVVIVLIFVISCVCVTNAESKILNISDIKGHIPSDMKITEQNIEEMFNPQVVPNEDDSSFIKALSGDGFTVQQGAMAKVDLVKYAEIGLLPDAEGNNADNPYYSIALPRSPGQTVANDNECPNGLSRNVRLNPDEAVVLIGKTPSNVTFYNFPLFMIYRTLNSERAFLFGGLGDTTNIGSVKEQTGSSDGLGVPIMIIYSADKTVAEKVKSVAEASGYPESMITIMEIPSPMVHMGLAEDDDSFACGIRTAVFSSPEAKQDYMDTINTMMRGYRITPNTSGSLDPYPVKNLRVRGTGTTEFDLLPAVSRLHDAIIEAYPNCSYKELETGIAFPESSQMLQNNEKAYGESRDAAYLGSQNFTLQPGQFAISYGVNHMASGKAIYSNVVAYGAEKLNGVASADSTSFTGSASRYLKDDPDVDKLYTYTITRANSTEPYTLVVPQGPYLQGVPLNQKIWIGWRAYMEEETNVGPTYPELVYDKVIVFTPK